MAGPSNILRGLALEASGDVEFASTRDNCVLSVGGVATSLLLKLSLSKLILKKLCQLKEFVTVCQDSLKSGAGTEADVMMFAKSEHRSYLLCLGGQAVRLGLTRTNLDC